MVHSAKADSCELWSQQLAFLFWGFAENHIYAINLQSNAGDQNRSAAQPAATIGESDINGLPVSPSVDKENKDDEVLLAQL